MKTNIIGRQLNVYADTKALIEKKLAKLDRYFKVEPDATVTLSRKRNVSTLEITINAQGTLFRSEIGADSFRDALDQSIDAIERQIRKNKTRLAKRIREDAFPIEEYFPEDLEQEEALVIRTKTFPYKPMSAEEAILQMELIGHQFFVFVDDQTRATCVVYKRKDDTYGLIMPE
ncbi:MAG: ribosome-associated translation inhibitor RaiA [Clostridia bacterium]|nr:ribosome-associated translation inhibitor RaiA [Clostridia bacterium]